MCDYINQKCRAELWVFASAKFLHWIRLQLYRSSEITTEHCKMQNVETNTVIILV